MQYDALLTFSHLRWDFVFQRPQHLLSRLSQNHRVIFVEEPMHDPAATRPRWERLTPTETVTVYRLHTNLTHVGFHDEQLALYKMMLPELLAAEQVKDYVAWFYTPMAYPLSEAIKPKAVVFDVMDELSAFLNAPPELLRRESELLKHADVVFTGGPSLYQAKKDRHHNVHCFSSSVDAKHFGAAKTEMKQPESQKNIPGPRLGFYGVIDERFDQPLVDALAAAHPEWQIVLVGPVMKIDPAKLPRRPNIHYMGQADYASLPLYLSGWDVALLPFARNASTKFISPTKTLEYMAAEKPIVSTPITDVKVPYGHIVYLGSTAEEFIKGCEQALSASTEEREQRTRAMRGVLAKTSWDLTAAAMEKLIDKAVAKKDPAAVAAAALNNGVTASRLNDDAVAATIRPDDEPKKPVVVIGAGPTGLSAAYHLGDDAMLVDQNDRVGGWCRSIVDKGFTFDFAGHIMFSNDPYVHELYKKLLGDNVHWQNREAWIYSKNVYTRYPFQGALYGLPPKVIKECVMGAIEARFGNTTTSADNQSKKLHGANGSLTATAPGQANGHANGNGNGKANGHVNGNGKGLHLAGARDEAKACSADVKDCCADGVMEASAKLVKPEVTTAEAAGTEPKNFEEFIYKVWGAGIAKHFAIPYNRKIWAVPLTEMETSWLGGRVPLPDLEEMIAGALEPVPPPMGPNARFGYPLKGGFQALMDGFLPHVQDRLHLNTRVTAVSPKDRTVTLDNGKTYEYDYLVSTMPLPVLVKITGAEAPEEVKQAAAGLRHTSVKCVNIGVGREHLTDKHWIYYPEETIFHRIFVQGNASPHCNAPGGFGLTCEITYGPLKPLPCDGQALIDRCIEDCHKVGFFGKDDPILTANVVDMPYAYVVYDHARPKNIATIRNWLAKHNIVLAGRYSEWEYYNSDHAFIAGKKIAEKVRELQGVPATNRVAAQVASF